MTTNLKMFVVILSFTQLSQANALTGSVDKVFDGTAEYCPEPLGVKYFDPKKVVAVEIESNTDLLIQMKVCTNGQWVRDSNLAVNEFTTLEQIHVIENHSKFELVIQSVNHPKKYQVIQLNQFEKSSTARIALADLSTVDVKAVDIYLQSVRKTRSSNGYDGVDMIGWGRHRISFK